MPPEQPKSWLDELLKKLATGIFSAGVIIVVFYALGSIHFLQGRLYKNGKVIENWKDFKVSISGIDKSECKVINGEFNLLGMYIFSVENFSILYGAPIHIIVESNSFEGKRDCSIWDACNMAIPLSPIKSDTQIKGTKQKLERKEVKPSKINARQRKTQSQLIDEVRTFYNQKVIQLQTDAQNKSRYIIDADTAKSEYFKIEQMFSTVPTGKPDTTALRTYFLWELDKNHDQAHAVILACALKELPENEQRIYSFPVFKTLRLAQDSERDFCDDDATSDRTKKSQNLMGELRWLASSVFLNQKDRWLTPAMIECCLYQAGCLCDKMVNENEETLDSKFFFQIQNLTDKKLKTNSHRRRVLEETIGLTNRAISNGLVSSDSPSVKSVYRKLAAILNRDVVKSWRLLESSSNFRDEWETLKQHMANKNTDVSETLFCKCYLVPTCK